MNLICKSCNHINSDIAVYCANCGKKVITEKNKKINSVELEKNSWGLIDDIFLIGILVIIILIIVVENSIIKRDMNHIQTKEIVIKETTKKEHHQFSLEVRATPSDSNILILELDKSYYKDMLLKEGLYTIIVSHDGYKPFSKKIILKHDSYVTAKLERINKKNIWECKIKWIIDKGEKFKPTNENLQTLSIELIDGADKLHLKTQNGESIYNYDSFIDLKDNNLGMNYTYGNRFIGIFEDKTLFLGSNEKGIDTKYYCKDMILNIRKSSVSSKNQKNILREENKTIITPIKKFSLTINTIPSKARVRILNIKPKYYDGMKLKEENYRIEISHDGYKTVKKWIKLNHNTVLDFKLEENQEQSYQKSINNKENDHYIYQGVNKAISIYIFDKLGIVGMRDGVENCYNKINDNSNQNDIKKCFSMDVASFLLDYNMAKILNFPQSEFFLQKNITTRLKESFSLTNIEYTEWEDTINNNWIPKIIKQYERTSEKSLLDK